MRHSRAVLAVLAVALAVGCVEKYADLRLPGDGALIRDAPAERRPAPSAGLVGVYALNAGLQRAQKLFPNIRGPETVVLWRDEAAFFPDDQGFIHRCDLAPPHACRRIAFTGGRPTGLAAHPAGWLAVCDPARGLLRVHPGNGSVELLAALAPSENLDAPVAGRRIMFADDVDAGPRSGALYFSDATQLPPIHSRLDGTWELMHVARLNLVQGEPSGRLLRFDPGSGQTRLLADGLWFANGVAVAPDESYVLVAETLGCRVLRLWLEGAKQGQLEVFVDGLPGFPDGVSRAPDGKYWIAIYSTRTAVSDLMPAAPRLLRWLVARLPPRLAPTVPARGMVVQVDAKGHVLRTLHDPDGSTCNIITSAAEADGRLYLGTLSGSHVCVLDLQQAAAR